MFYYVFKRVLHERLYIRALTLFARANNRLQNRLTYTNQLRMHINSG